jgi:hypothetical protein
MSFIRGHEPAEHSYVKGIATEVCHQEGWIVGEEVILPNGSKVDIVAIKDGKLKLIEITTSRIAGGSVRGRREKLKQYGKLRLVKYNVGESPDRNTVEAKVRKILRGE